MIKILELLIYGHQHKWNHIKTISVSNEYNYYLFTTYHCQCTVCGKIKKFKVQ